MIVFYFIYLKIKNIYISQDSHSLFIYTKEIIFKYKILLQLIDIKSYISYKIQNIYIYIKYCQVLTL